MAYTSDKEDLRAFSSFDKKTQAALRAGQTITGGDGRKFVLIDGHATAVGSDSYTRGMAAREEGRESPSVEQSEPSTATDPRPLAPGATPPPPVGGGGTSGSGSGSDGLLNFLQNQDAEAKAAKAQADALAKQNAGDYLQGVLDQYGLGSLKDFAWSEIQNGRTSAEVLNDIRQTPQFKDRFPAIIQREQYNLTHPGANLPPLSPGEYVSYENSYKQLLRNAGLPQGFMDDPKTVTNLLANDVSVAEMTNRVEQARVATYDLPPEALARLQQIHGIGPGSGALTALMLDPTQAEPLLKRDLLAAQIGGQADRTGYLGLNNTTAQVLAQNGVTAQQAQSGFNSLQHDQPLFNALPGTQERDITQPEQLAAQFDQNAEDQRLIDQRRNSRLSQFADQGSGSYAGTQQGLTGLNKAPF
jgi:hypothetical protein